jgi:hypothetical protein
MRVLRGLLLDNLGLKLVALLLAVVVYLHVFTERAATMVVFFPIQLVDLSDSLTLSGPAPPGVQAELRGSGKQFIRLWLTEPRFRVSLAGVRPGHFRRLVSLDDLPIIPSDKLDVMRLVGPDTLELQIERKIARNVAVAPRIEGVPKAGVSWQGEVMLEPATVLVRGPRKVVAALDSVRLETVRIGGRRDSVRALVRPMSLPEWCTVEPPSVAVTVPLVRVQP